MVMDPFNRKISEMPDALTLTGAELVPLVQSQSGVLTNVKAAINSLLSFVGVTFRVGVGHTTSSTFTFAGAGSASVTLSSSTVTINTPAIPDHIAFTDSDNTFTMRQDISLASHSGATALSIVGDTGVSGVTINDRGEVIISSDAAGGSFPLRIRFGSSPLWDFGFTGQLVDRTGNGINWNGLAVISNIAGATTVDTLNEMVFRPGSLGGTGTRAITIESQDPTDMPFALQQATGQTEDMMRVVDDTASVTLARIVAEGWYRMPGANRLLLSAATNSSTALASLTDLSIPVVSGRSYIGRLSLTVGESIAGGGVKVDFGGGSSSGVFSASITALPTAGGVVCGTLTSASLGGTLTLTTGPTTSCTLSIDFQFTASSTGTLIPRFALLAALGIVGVIQPSFLHVTMASN